MTRKQKSQKEVHLVHTPEDMSWGQFVPKEETENRNGIQGTEHRMIGNHHFRKSINQKTKKDRNSKV
jgi:hypothetical protein